MLGKNSADNILIFFIFFFFRKQALTFHANCQLLNLLIELYYRVKLNPGVGSQKLWTNTRPFFLIIPLKWKPGISFKRSSDDLYCLFSKPDEISNC